MAKLNLMLAPDATRGKESEYIYGVRNNAMCFYRRPDRDTITAGEEEVRQRFRRAADYWKASLLRRAYGGFVLTPCVRRRGRMVEGRRRRLAEHQTDGAGLRHERQDFGAGSSADPGRPSEDAEAQAFLPGPAHEVIRRRCDEWRQFFRAVPKLAGLPEVTTAGHGQAQGQVAEIPVCTSGRRVFLPEGEHEVDRACLQLGRPIGGAAAGQLHLAGWFAATEQGMQDVRRQHRIEADPEGDAFLAQGGEPRLGHVQVEQQVRKVRDEFAAGRREAERLALEQAQAQLRLKLEHLGAECVELHRPGQVRQGSGQPPVPDDMEEQPQAMGIDLGIRPRLAEGVGGRRIQSFPP